MVERWGWLDESLNRDLDDIATSYSFGRTVVVEQDGAVIGTGTVVPRGDSTVEIVRMAVAALARRSGTGRRIVCELVATARRWAATRVILETNSSWPDAVAFYLACGFRAVEETDGDFGRITWFELSLPPQPDDARG